MEQSAPATYKGMVEMYGPDLEKVQYGWMDEYNYAATKYILIPMYDFFEANPELLESGRNDIPVIFFLQTIGINGHFGYPNRVNRRVIIKTTDCQ